MTMSSNNNQDDTITNNAKKSIPTSSSSSYYHNILDISSKTYESITHNISSLPEHILHTTASSLYQTSSSLSTSISTSLSSSLASSSSLLPAGYNTFQNNISSYLWTSYNGYYNKLYPMLYSNNEKHNNNNNALTNYISSTSSGSRSNSWNWFMENNPFSGYRSGDLDTNATSRQSIRSIISSLQLHELESIAEDKEQEIVMEISNSSEGNSEDTKESATITTAASTDVFGSVSDAEKASRLAEGSILILRDMILDEAVELHESLRYWNDLWERPFLSWLEAGPIQWMSEEGYNHQNVGNKVSQIQAVLARRCESVGELQQQLLRAGWNYGVAQWGVLGQGKQWAAVAGGNECCSSTDYYDNSSSGNGNNTMKFTSPYHMHHKTRSNNTIGKNIDSELASWTIDAILSIRNFLYIGGSYQTTLPFSENWPLEMNHFLSTEFVNESTVITHNDDDDNDDEGHYSKNDNSNDQRKKNKESTNYYLPTWATKQIIPKSNIDKNNIKNSNNQSYNIIISITDLPLMAAEVSALLSIMEDQLQVQRNRQLMKLKPPSRLRSKWIIWVTTLPLLGYCAWWFCRGNRGMDLMKHVLFKVSSFWMEHVSEPLQSICAELFTGKGRVDITDLKARLNAMQSLQAMIKDWLDKSYPKLPNNERQLIANSMDISLIEKRKENSLKHYGGPLFEIQDLVHMSLIEMQFIKKELLNAMSAIDDLMESNEMNFRLAAMAPTFLIMYAINGCYKFLSYGIFKFGKSKDEIYAALRYIILDIERLLVMRDDPPNCLDNKNIEYNNEQSNYSKTTTTTSNNQNNNNQVLGSYDLGMLMLLVHECRSILRKHRKRFTRTTLKNVTEDLAELAGERGVVSVKQQLQIISRMCRTYSFLKVVSSGVRFVDVSRYV